MHSCGGMNFAKVDLVDLTAMVSIDGVMCMGSVTESQEVAVAEGMTPTGTMGLAIKKDVIGPMPITHTMVSGRGNTKGPMKSASSSVVVKGPVGMST